MKCWPNQLGRLIAITCAAWLFSQSPAAAQSLTKATIRPISTPKSEAYDWHQIEQQIEYSPQDAPVVAPGANASDKLFRPITSLDLDIRNAEQKRPQDRATELLNYSQRDWSAFEPISLAYLWEAPDIRFQPLYFQDIALERYGQTCRPGQQVAQSAVHFGVNFLTLPYHLIIDPSWNCDTPYGYCRPGSNAPCIRERFLYPY